MAVREARLWERVGKLEALAANLQTQIDGLGHQLRDIDRLLHDLRSEVKPVDEERSADPGPTTAGISIMGQSDGVRVRY